MCGGETRRNVKRRDSPIAVPGRTHKSAVASDGAIGELIPLDILQLLQYHEIYDA
jgi:hypothetical protein